MEFVFTALFVGIVLGYVLARLVDANKAAEGPRTEPPVESGPPAPAADAAAASARLRALAIELDPQMQPLAHPFDALDLPDFRAGVALLREPTFTGADLAGFATGGNWVVTCLALEALAGRDDGSEAVETVRTHLRHLAAWPLAFALRFLEAKYDGPALADALASAQEWWHENAWTVNALNDAARRCRDRGAKIGFAGRLADGVDDEQALATLLRRLDRNLFADMEREFHAWRSARVDNAFHRSIGTVLLPHEEKAWLPDSPRMREYVDQMIRAQPDDGARSILLVGDPGAGNASIARHFVRHLAAQGWRNLETSAVAIIAGKKYIGEIEGQVEKLRVHANARKRVALHVREFHELAGAGVYRGKPEGLLEQLLPAIESGELLVVGRTTPDAYQRVLRRVPRLALAMEVIRVEPAGEAETLALAREFLTKSGACGDADAAERLADETLALARQHLPFARLPGGVLRLLEMVLLTREETGPGAPPIGRDDVLLALSRLTGLPLDVLDENQTLSIAQLTAAFERRVIGQSEAVQCLVERVAMLKAGLTDATRPIGVFLFAGPTGTGKTELAKALAELLFGDEERLIRLDMSEFQRPDSLDKILGGTDGLARDHSLTGRIRQQPFSVILLDEFEKAHERVWDLFLQVFDDGRLSDHAGNVVDFRHTIVLLTSNLGATIREHPGPGFTGTAGGFSASEVLRAVRRSFRKEFINRLDRVVVFKPLSREVMRRILNKELRQALERRGFRHREWAVEWEDTAVTFLLEKGFTLDMGARPLRRAIERYFLAPLSMTIVENRFPSGDQFLFVRSDAERLQVSFVDPDAGDEPETAAAAESGALTLRGIALHPGNASAERDLLLAQSELVIGRIESPEWVTEKSAQLARVNEPGFWDDPARHEVLDHVEFLDRLEAAVAAVGRLARRLRNGGGSRELNAALAQKLYLLDTALADLDEDRPRHAFLRLEASSTDGDDVARRAFEAALGMYRSWAGARGMRMATVRDDDTGADPSVTLSVTGFGAYTLLAPERGLHLFEYPRRRGDGTQRAHVVVRIAAQPPQPPGDAAGFAKLADRAFAVAAGDESVLVRRYSCLASPLVRDKVNNWRTGRLDLVLAGNFDLIEA